MAGVYRPRHPESMVLLRLMFHHFERMGDKAGAAKCYRKFLDLWKDANPCLPEVENARQRLTGLTAM